MGEIHQLRARAERSRQAEFAVPVVASVAEARALAQRIAGQLAEVSDREALLCLAWLQDVETVLSGRIERLKIEMAATRRELDKTRESVAACRRYGAAAALTVHRPGEAGG